MVWQYSLRTTRRREVLRHGTSIRGNWRVKQIGERAGKNDMYNNITSFAIC